MNFQAEERQQSHRLITCQNLTLDGGEVEEFGDLEDQKENFF